MTCLIK
jgi:hypothetical protein